MKFLKIIYLKISFPILVSLFLTEAFGQNDNIVNHNIVIEQEGKRVEIAEADLPAPIREHITENYPKAIFLEAFKYVNDEGVAIKYSLRLERLNKKDLRLFYDGKGEAITTTD